MMIIKFYRLTFLPVAFLFYLGCNNNQNSYQVGLHKKVESSSVQDYRGDMRAFVLSISKYAKAKNSNFAIIPQNGIELVTDTGDGNGKPMLEYIDAIDGNGQEDLFYGYKGDNKSTPQKVTAYLSSLLKVSQSNGNSIFVIDYCTSGEKVEKSYKRNYELGFVPFVATERNLNGIPPSIKLDQKNANDITTLSEAKNFLFFLNYEEFETKNDVMEVISNTDYDVIFMDLFFNNGQPFTSEEIQKLKSKADGGKRLVCSYMSIGEAEDYRYYWQNDWTTQKPTWLDSENKNWPGNYKVQYWNKDWQNIILGNEDAYLDKILQADFDGVYMDIIDAFEHFENK